MVFNIVRKMSGVGFRRLFWQQIFRLGDDNVAFREGCNNSQFAVLGERFGPLRELFRPVAAEDVGCHLCFAYVGSPGGCHQAGMKGHGWKTISPAHSLTAISRSSQCNSICMVAG